jgi:hypothetical protein
MNNTNYPPHLSFVEVEIHPGIKGVGRVYYQTQNIHPSYEEIISVSGVSCDVDGLFYEKGFWFEWTVQLNHLYIKHNWKLLQE